MILSRNWNKLPLMFIVLMGVTSCATWSRTFFASDLSKITLGENKSFVVEKLGGTYTPVASAVEDGHRLELFEFVEKPLYVGRVNKAYWTRYWVYFMDDRLVKYERATAENLLEHQRWVQDVLASAATIEAFKGTSAMPYHVEHSGRVDSNVNVTGRIDVR